MFPSLYEINTRVWRHRFGQDTQLIDIPDSYWKQLAGTGMEYVWLMGVWQTPDNACDYGNIRDLHPSYKAALPDWRKEDVIGSPYAIDHYELHKDLGAPGDLLTLKQKINAAGLQLILDFVPNHFHATSSWIESRPDAFLEVGMDQFYKNKNTFYQASNLQGQFFAHGKDPYFDAWQDTVQVNYASAAGREFMLEQLLHVAQYCDGLRCDMAMLMLPDVFQKTWGHCLESQSPQYAEFWPEVIKQLKTTNPSFCLIAEVYWDLEWKLQQQGFDYTYDKRLLDRLLHEPQTAIRNHLKAESNFQAKSVRFLENHDEDRILSEMSVSKAMAAAVATYTLPGMRFFYQGQWEGRIIRLPVQLGREPQEPQNNWLPNTEHLPASIILDQFDPVKPEVVYFYHFLLQVLKKTLLKSGAWALLDQSEQSPILAWKWILEEKQCLIVINYSETTHDFETTFDGVECLDIWGNRAIVPKNGRIRVNLTPYQFAIIENE